MHARYEDPDGGGSASSLALGFVFEDLSSVSADDLWNPTFLTVRPPVLFFIMSDPFSWSGGGPQLRKGSLPEHQMRISPRAEGTYFCTSWGGGGVGHGVRLPSQRDSKYPILNSYSIGSIELN